MQELSLDQRPVPLDRILVGTGHLGGEARGRALDHAQRLGLELFPALEREQPQRVNHFPLLVHHVVELEQALPGLEVLQLDAFLGLADGARHPGVGDDLALFDQRPRAAALEALLGLLVLRLAAVRAAPRRGPRLVHPARDAVRAEQPHQIVFQGEEEDALPRVALAARPAAQLAVDAPRLVALGADDDEPARRVVVALELEDLPGREVRPLGDLAERRLAARADAADLTFLHARAEFDVGAAAGHVRRDRHRSRLARLRDNLGFALVVLRVQHFVLHPASLQHARQRLRHVDAHRAHQHRQAALVHAVDFLDDGRVLLAPRLVDEVVLVHPPHRAIGRDHHDFELVDLVELGFLGLGRPRHPGQLLVHPEVVLAGDRREGLGLFAHHHVFLRFHRLVQAVRPAPAGHEAAGELVHDEDLPLLHDVVHVLLVEHVRLEQLVDDVEDLILLRVLELRRAAPLDLLAR